MMPIPLLVCALVTMAPAYAPPGVGTAAAHAAVGGRTAAAASALDRARAVTDTVLAVERGTRLEASNRQGEITVRAWNRDAVRIRAEHDDGDRLEIDRSGPLLRVRSRARRGPAGRVEYRIQVPEWMAVRLSGRSGDIDVEGVGGRLEAQTVQGDIRVIGAGGPLTLRSVQGEIRVEAARGGVEAHTVNDEIRIVRSAGDIAAETVNGEIVLDGLDSRVARASTVNGDIEYRGAIRADGRYRFVTHNGDVTVAVPEDAGASVSVSTYNGGFEADFPVRLTDNERGRRFSLVLGNGGAQVEIEAFQGEIRLRRPD